MRKLLLLFLLLGIAPAQAADNYTATAGAGLTFAAKDVGGGGILYPWWIPANSSGTELFTSGNPGKVDPGTPANWGVGATAAAVPARAVYLGINTGGNLVGWTGAITGTVTANGGTNLNTSLLALETGGNLATIAGAVTGNVVQSNTKQVNGIATSTGTGAVGTGTQRVAVGTDTATIAGSAPGTAGAASANVLTVQGVTSMTPVQVSQATAASLNATVSQATAANLNATVAQATAANLNATITGSGSAGTPATGVVTVQGAASMTPLLVTQSNTNDPCTTLAKTSVPISQTANTKLVTKVSAKKTYICNIMAVGADAENLSLVEGTQTTNPCDTSTAAIIGGTTAAAGANLAANGGFTMGSGGNTIASGATVNLDICLFQSGSGRVAGVLTYVQN